MLYTVELTPAQKRDLVAAVERDTVEIAKRASRMSDPGVVALLEKRVADQRAIIAAIHDAEAG